MTSSGYSPPLLVIIASLVDSDGPLMTSGRQISKSRLSHGGHVGVLLEGTVGTSPLESGLTDHSRAQSGNRHYIQESD